MPYFLILSSYETFLNNGKQGKDIDDCIAGYIIYKIMKYLTITIKNL